jgi:ketosteroid isomerase-like protein
MTTEFLHQFAVRYIAFCNDPDSDAEGLREFYADDVVWQEMPHQFAPAGRIHDLAGLQAAFAAGQKMMAEQHYILENVVAGEDAAALQLRWETTLAQDLGDLAAGDKLTGNAAIIFRLQDGKIVRQADYLSYDPR